MADVITRFKVDSSEYTKKVGQARSMLDEFGLSGKQTNQLLGQFEKTLGVNIASFGKLTIGVGAASAALKVAKDAFMQSERNIDEWGRTIKGAEGAYDVFLQSINNGNWSNFFSNLSTAVQGARDLYDALDRLGSIKSNNQAAIAIVQQEIAQLRLAKQQGENVDAQLKAATERLTALQGMAVNAGKAAGKTQMRNALRNSINSTLGNGSVNDATIDFVSDRILRGGQKWMDSYERSYHTLRAKGMTEGTSSYTDSLGNVHSYTTPTFDINKLSKEEQKQYAIAKAVTERESEIAKGIGTYAQAVQEGTANAREQFRNNRYSLAGASGGRTGAGITAKAKAPGTEVSESLTQLQILQDQLKTVQNSMAGYGKNTEEWQAMNEEAKSLADQIARINGDPLKAVTTESLSQLQIMEDQLATIKASMQNASNPEDWKEMADEAERMERAIKNFKGETDPKKAFSLTDNKYFKGAAQMGSGVAQIGSALEGMGIELGKGFDKTISVMQSVFGVIEGVQAIISAIQIFQTSNDAVQTGLLATIATNTAVSATTDAVKSIPIIGTFLHNGGLIHAANGVFVPGSPNGGRDTVPAMLSPGELVLNVAQQQQLASVLTGMGVGGMQLETVIHGEDLRIMLNNNSRRRGRGEYVTSRGR